MSTSTFFFCSILISFFIENCSAHGFLQHPKARNFIAYENGKDYDPMSKAAGGPGVVGPKVNGVYLSPDTIESSTKRHGMCGDPVDGPQTYNGPVQNYENNIQQVYTEGNDITLEILITAHHMGHFEFYICDTADLKNPEKGISQECLYKHKLVRSEAAAANSISPIDPNYPDRYYLEPRCEMAYQTSSEGYAGYKTTMTYKLPEGLTCDHCVLQWWWYTANSCVHPGYREHAFPSNGCNTWWKSYLGDCTGSGSYPEEFWNCADIQIKSKNGGDSPQQPITPAPTSAAIVPVPDPAPATAPAPAPEPAPAPSPDSGSQSGECISVSPQVTDQWCQQVQCDSVYVDGGFCAYSGSAGGLSPSPSPPAPAPAPAPESEPAPAPAPAPNPNPAPSPTGSTLGECISASPQVTDEWCRDVQCASVYIDGGYCAYSGTAPSPSEPAPVPVPVPVPSPDNGATDPNPAPAPVPAPAPAPNPVPGSIIDVDVGETICDRVVVGYYIAWGIYGRKFFPWDMDVSKLTHVNYAFANLADDGSVLIGDSWADTEITLQGESWPGSGNFGALRRLKAQYPHLKTLISIGGWTWSENFPSVAADASKRAKFVSTSIDFMLEHGFDGIDIDWEFPVEGGPSPGTQDDPENFTKLLTELRTALEKLDKHYLLTLATTQNPNRVQYLEIPKISPLLDFINVMTYDFAGPWSKGVVTGHNAPLYQSPNDPTATASLFNVDSAVTSYLDAGLPRNKLVLGVPFYGYIYGGVSAGSYHGLYSSWDTNVEGTWANNIVDYDDIRDNYLSSGDWEYHFDANTKVPYIYSQSKQQFVSFDDVHSLAAKTTYVKELNLKGVMIWDLSSDRDSDLLTALTAELQECTNQRIQNRKLLRG